PSLTDAQVRKMVGGSVEEAIAHCEKLVDPWHFGVLKPDWLVDPAPKLGHDAYVQIWDLEIPVSTVGGTITTTVSGGPEVRFIGSAGRALTASFLTRAGDTLELRLRESAGPLHSSPLQHRIVANEVDHAGGRRSS